MTNTAMKLVSREEALKDKTAHAFMHGTGYVYIGQPICPTIGDAAKCSPPKSAKPGSLHDLLVRGARKRMRWDGQLWEHPHSVTAGNRLAFAPGYLAANGWAYGDAIKEVVTPQPEKKAS